MRIDEIANLQDLCTGCMACVDSCPEKCVIPILGKDGFRYTKIESSRCTNCGKCYAVCPIDNIKKHEGQQRLYASYAKCNDVRKRGSSGGIFELLATQFINRGFYVCGAAFEENKLFHRIVNSNSELRALLKSKYLQSNTSGIYDEILALLKEEESVFFCGTPCQVSAVNNYIPEKLHHNLFTADIICHGVPSQETFDMYIESLEKKSKGKVTDFSFRVKDNKYEHAHGFTYKITQNGKTTTVNGLYPQSTFYNGFKKYLFFRQSCYDCRYSSLSRVSDITLGDFWGIEKYDFTGNTDTGVSMIITNTPKGEQAFSALNEQVMCKEFPISYGVESNHCLTKCTDKPTDRDEIIDKLHRDGYDSTALKYFSSDITQRIYLLMPTSFRNLLRRIRRG